MDASAPMELGRLLHAPDSAVREAAWDALIARQTRLLLGVARSFGGGHDEAMERYAYIVEKLREDSFHRLRTFQLDGRAQFSTWLTVAARRLCLDHLRSRYGRTRPTRDPGKTTALRGLRRLLADSQGANLDTDLLADPGAMSADRELICRERDAGLAAALTSLPPQDRLLLALRFEDDLSAAKIAGLVGLPTPFHVYRRLNNVLATLRAALRSHGIEDSAG